MFGFIKNLFAGIFGFFGSLFGSKKSGYFLDLDEGQGKKPAKAEPTAAQPLAAGKPEAAKAAKAEPAKVETPKTAPKESKVEASPKPKPEPAKGPAATNGKVSGAVAPVLTFAPDYLMPTPTTSRRLPGPSLNGFREMARQVKTK